MENCHYINYSILLDVELKNLNVQKVYASCSKFMMLLFNAEQEITMICDNISVYNFLLNGLKIARI